MRRLALVALLLAGCAAAPTESGGDPTRAAQLNAQLALGYLREGRTELAAEKIAKALAAGPDQPGVHSTAALVYQALGEAEKAEEHYRRALELAPEDGRLHNNYGVFLCGRGRYAEAEAAFKAALATPRYATPERAYENLGACARRAGELEKAEAYLRKALSYDPKLPLALHEMAGVTFATGRPLNARAYVQRYLEVAEPTPEILWLGVQVERRLGDREAAERYADQLSRRFPRSPEAQALLQEAAP